MRFEEEVVFVSTRVDDSYCLGCCSSEEEVEASVVDSLEKVFLLFFLAMTELYSSERSLLLAKDTYEDHNETCTTKREICSKLMSEMEYYEGISTLSFSSLIMS